MKRFYDSRQNPKTHEINSFCMIKEVHMNQSNQHEKLMLIKETDYHKARGKYCKHKDWWTNNYQ